MKKDPVTITLRRHDIDILLQATAFSISKIKHKTSPGYRAQHMAYDNLVDAVNAADAKDPKEQQQARVTFDEVVP